MNHFRSNQFKKSSSGSNESKSYMQSNFVPGKKSTVPWQQQKQSGNAPWLQTNQTGDIPQQRSNLFGSSSGKNVGQSFSSSVSHAQLNSAMPLATMEVTSGDSTTAASSIFVQPGDSRNFGSILSTSTSEQRPPP